MDAVSSSMKYDSTNRLSLVRNEEASSGFRRAGGKRSPEAAMIQVFRRWQEQSRSTCDADTGNLGVAKRKACHTPPSFCMFDA